MPSSNKAIIFLRTFLQRLHLSLTLTQRFAVLGFIATLTVASLSAFFITHYLSQLEFEELSNRASDAVSHLVTPIVTTGDFKAENSNASWLKQIEEIINITGNDAITVWNPQGAMLHASNESLEARTLDATILKSVLETNEPFAKKSINEAGEATFNVYVPIIPEGATKAVAVYELCQDFAPVAAHIKKLSVSVWSLSLLILGFMFFALLATLAASKRQQMSHADPLTGLANRHRFQEKAESILALARHSDNAAILYLDLSRFKAVNDSLGQAAGDDILKQVAQRLKESIRAEDTAARLGGDEFALLLLNIDSGERAVKVAQRLKQLFKVPFKTQNQSVHLEVNIGIAMLGREGIDSLGTWLTQANTAMLKAKTAHTEFQIYNPQMESYTLERLKLESSLREALSLKEFVLHYQPILTTEQTIIGAEALIRWIHPEDGMISPAVFIPLAEETGLIRQLDQWVMRTAIRQARNWENQGRPIKVSVNLSPQTFQDAGFVPWLESQLLESELNPSLLTVEITEYVLAQAESSRKALQALKHLGVRVALDDFGKGYSSLSYLENLPIDRIKMDRQFIQGIGKRPASEAIIKTIIALTKNLGIESLAEGIEDAEQFKWLEREGCEFFQGYLFGKPLPVERFSREDSHYLIEDDDSSVAVQAIHLN